MTTDEFERSPIAAFGNSDGGFAMLERVTAGTGPRFGLLVHHDDAAREFAYDRTSTAGTLDRGLDEAKARGWTLVGMKTDWQHVFQFELSEITNGVRSLRAAGYSSLPSQ
jgi:hypothetical protein